MPVFGSHMVCLGDESMLPLVFCGGRQIRAELVNLRGGGHQQLQRPPVITRRREVITSDIGEASCVGPTRVPRGPMRVPSVPVESVQRELDVEHGNPEMMVMGARRPHELKRYVKTAVVDPAPTLDIAPDSDGVLKKNALVEL